VRMATGFRVRDLKDKRPRALRFHITTHSGCFERLTKNLFAAVNTAIRKTNITDELIELSITGPLVGR
jgi:hypothetical protein